MAKAIPKTYKYGTCAECGLGLWRDGKCFLYPFHSQETGTGGGGAGADGVGG